VADRYLVIGRNAVIGEGAIPAESKGRTNVMHGGQRVRLQEWKGVLYVVTGWLDPDQIEKVLGPHVGK
jgi:hypothetical protein